jgi:hypothetical protein
LSTGQPITIRQPSFTMAGRITVRIGDGAVTTGGDGYFAGLLLPNNRPSVTSVMM